MNGGSGGLFICSANLAQTHTHTYTHFIAQIQTRLRNCAQKCARARARTAFEYDNDFGYIYNIELAAYMRSVRLLLNIHDHRVF